MPKSTNESFDDLPKLGGFQIDLHIAAASVVSGKGDVRKRTARLSVSRTTCEPKVPEFPKQVLPT